MVEKGEVSPGIAPPTLPGKGTHGMEDLENPSPASWGNPAIGVAAKGKRLEPEVAWRKRKPPDGGRKVPGMGKRWRTAPERRENLPPMERAEEMKPG